VDPAGNAAPATCIAARTVDVESTPVAVRFEFALRSENPVRGEARFHFALPEAGPVELAIYDVSGRRVATLVDEVRDAGDHSASWRRTTDAGAPVPPGIFFARIRAAGDEAQLRIVTMH
jgi:flagellar hook assembly protein FlgD